MWWTFSSFETTATKKDSDIGRKYRNSKENKVMLIVKRSNPSSKTFAVLLLTAPKHNSYLWLYFSALNLLSIPWDLPLTREITQEKLSSISKLQFLKAKIYSCSEKKPFGTWQYFKIGVLINFTIKELKYCKIALFFVYVSSLMRSKSERIEKKSMTEKFSLTHLSFVLSKRMKQS